MQEKHSLLHIKYDKKSWFQAHWVNENVQQQLENLKSIGHSNLMAVNRFSIRNHCSSWWIDKALHLVSTHGAWRRYEVVRWSLCHWEGVSFQPRTQQGPGRDLPGMCMGPVTDQLANQDGCVCKRNAAGLFQITPNIMLQHVFWEILSSNVTRHWIVFFGLSWNVREFPLLKFHQMACSLMSTASLRFSHNYAFLFSHGYEGTEKVECRDFCCSQWRAVCSR